MNNDPMNESASDSHSVRRGPTAGSRVCCAGTAKLAWALGGLAVGMLVIVAAYFLGRQAATTTAAATNASLSETEATRLAGPLPGIDAFPAIHADSAVTSEKFSMATGQISDEAEGLVVLDHNSGLLQVRVVYPRTGQFLANFSAQVGDALGSAGKATQYLMVTGRAGFIRSSSNPVGSSVIYVMDAATGNYAAYVVPFQQQAVPRNQPQKGVLRVIGTGSANPLVDRDALR